MASASLELSSTLLSILLKCIFFTFAAFNESACDRLPYEKYRQHCSRLGSLFREGIYNQSERSSTIFRLILGNATASEITARLLKEGLDSPEPLHDASLRGRGFSYLYRHGREDELYDLSEDPGEQRNIIGERPDVARDMRERLLERHAASRALVLSERSRF